MKKIWFIRHGESVSNANLRTTHPAKSALTEKGLDEARLIATAFEEKPDLIVTSSFLRAQQTAVPTIEHFEPIPVIEWPVHEFTYLHPDRYNGTTGTERGPHALAYWERCDPHEKELGAGESFAELLARVQETKNRCRTMTESFVAVFTHGLFTRALLWSWVTGIEVATASTMERYSHFVRGVWMPNGSILEVTLAENGRFAFSGFQTAHMALRADKT